MPEVVPKEMARTGRRRKIKRKPARLGRGRYTGGLAAFPRDVGGPEAERAFG